jgi:hypothetical protein
MRFGIPLIIFVITLALVAVGPLWSGRSIGTVGIAQGPAIPGLDSAKTPEAALANFLLDVQRRNWDAAYKQTAANAARADEAFIGQLAGTNGSLRSFSNLAGWDLRPLQATGDDARFQATLHWATPVGQVNELRDLTLHRENDGWKINWPVVNVPEVPPQVIPVNYLRWDLVSSSSDTGWGQRSVDSPKVRIVSMNPVAYDGGSILVGEVVNEDTIPAFVNVNATLAGADGKPIDEESSFDKISHVLLPKEVSPYRIDFPGIELGQVKGVHMDVKSTLVPASADPTIGVMNQKLQKAPDGNGVLSGELLNEGGQVVNIPHVIATFYDNSGRVVWVSDGYVERALLPQTPESFAVEVPASFADKVQSFHVMVNHYNLSNS